MEHFLFSSIIFCRFFFGQKTRFDQKSSSISTRRDISSSSVKQLGKGRVDSSIGGALKFECSWTFLASFQDGKKKNDDSSPFHQGNITTSTQFVNSSRIKFEQTLTNSEQSSSQANLNLENHQNLQNSTISNSTTTSSSILFYVDGPFYSWSEWSKCSVLQPDRLKTELRTEKLKKKIQFFVISVTFSHGIHITVN